MEVLVIDNGPQSCLA